MDRFVVVLQQALNRLALLAKVTTAQSSTLEEDTRLRRVCQSWCRSWPAMPD